MKTLFLTALITLSIVMVSCGGNNTGNSSDSTQVDFILVDTTEITIDTLSVDTVN
jgi:hypothetical protein